MSGLGLHIALSDAELLDLLAKPIEDRADYISNELEEKKFDTVDACETDKSWAYMHAAFNGTDPNGKLSTPQTDEGFLSKLLGRRRSPVDSAARFAIVGHESLVDSGNYFVGLIRSDETKNVWNALVQISEDQLRDRVFANHKRFNASGSPADVSEYAASWYPGLVKFFCSASAARKHVIFTVDF